MSMEIYCHREQKWDKREKNLNSGSIYLLFQRFQPHPIVFFSKLSWLTRHHVT